MTERKEIPPPKGMESYDIRRENDLGALNDEQQQKLNQHKVCFCGSTWKSASNFA